MALVDLPTAPLDVLEHGEVVVDVLQGRVVRQLSEDALSCLLRGLFAGWHEEDPTPALDPDPLPGTIPRDAATTRGSPVAFRRTSSGDTESHLEGCVDLFQLRCVTGSHLPREAAARNRQ